MRFLVALLLATATLSVTPLPTSAACHPDPASPWEPTNAVSSPGVYVVRDVGFGGCPHQASLCLQVWRETNGQPGLQTGGSNPDKLVLLVCPL